MKKSSVLLIALTILPFSTSRCLTDNQATFIGCATIVGIGTGYYYYNYHYKPSLNNTNTTNNPDKNTAIQRTAMPNQNKTLVTLVQERFPQASKPEVNTEINTPKILPITKQTEEKTTPEVASVKITHPTIITETPTNNVEPIAKTESCFLNNVHNSIKKMNLKRLLSENIDVLEG
jgi:hypothetical protein